MYEHPVPARFVLRRRLDSPTETTMVTMPRSIACTFFQLSMCRRQLQPRRYNPNAEFPPNRTSLRLSSRILENHICVNNVRGSSSTRDRCSGVSTRQLQPRWPLRLLAIASTRPSLSQKHRSERWSCLCKSPAVTPFGRLRCVTRPRVSS